MIYIFVFAIGACIGSFLALVSYRRNKNEGYIFGRSHCDYCGKRLKVEDNIPIISYFILRGKSSCCKKKIDLSYLIYEIVVAVGLLIGYLKFGLNWKFIIFIIIFTEASLIAITDIKYMDIYDIDTLILTIALIIFRILDHSFTFETIKTMFFIVLNFYLIYKLTGAMGLGDVLLSISLGAVSKGLIDSFYNFTYTFLLGAVVAIVLMLLKIKDRKDYIPFGPFIVITVVGVLLCKF